MGTYDFKRIEKHWQNYWKENNTFIYEHNPTKQKFYILDMFPYPSGSGLHVGHPLGYVSTSIISKYKRLKGFNVLRPMGFDSFGLPAENFAIQSGKPPSETTEINIRRYKQQLEHLALGYDPTREFRTSDPGYYRWTQWIFLKLFTHWYNNTIAKAEPIEKLIGIFNSEGNIHVDACTSCDIIFSAEEWTQFSEKQQADILMKYRLAFTAESYVNWCQELGTVLANEEVKDGVSERGGHPVERRLMRQWELRITAYAERLINDLEGLEWPNSLLDMQRNWIGKSQGATLYFQLKDTYEQLLDSELDSNCIEVFTTRPDTVFGSTFIVLAPEHPLVNIITTKEQSDEIKAYVNKSMLRSERQRQSEIKNFTGVFTGAYVINPFTKKEIPVYIGDYVLFGYGSGAIMAVPAHDSRDHAFAKSVDLPIISVIEGINSDKEAYDAKSGKLCNSGFINGLEVKEAIEKIINEIENRGIGKRKINYRLRDAVFSRQRYWGEPFPIVYKNDIAYPVSENELPVTLPKVSVYKTTGTGQSPLASVEEWVNLPNGFKRETDTMPGWAGSSWYFFRYMDPHNELEFVSKEKASIWAPVDLYVGGSEHAVGHLLYSRFWTKFLYDIGKSPVQEPFKKLVNQGMIQGRSSIIYRHKVTLVYESMPLSESKENYIPIHADVNIVKDDYLDVEAFRRWSPANQSATFKLNSEGKFACDSEIEKMSKTYYNVVNPDDVCEQYGSDSFRLYEMFLGPIEQSKPWSTQGINGVFNFLKKVYSLFIDDQDYLRVTEETPTSEELKILHQTIKKVEEDIERLSFNTSVSAFMICLNDLTKHKVLKRAILEPFLIILAPFAPHICEELWQRLGHTESILKSEWPAFNPLFLIENSFEYPISINGKTKLKLQLPLDLAATEVEKAVLASEAIRKLIGDKQIKKVVVVQGKIVNVVL